MPRKSTKSVAPASAIAATEEIIDTPTVVVEIEVDASKTQYRPVSDSTNETPVEEEVAVVATKTRKTIVEKIDTVLELIENNASVGAITKQLQTIRKALDGAQIKASKKTRKPNQYNLFMSEQMEKLKESELPATERFKYCIKLWNERKETEASA